MLPCAETTHRSRRCGREQKTDEGHVAGHVYSEQLIYFFARLQIGNTMINTAAQMNVWLPKDGGRTFRSQKKGSFYGRQTCRNVL